MPGIAAWGRLSTRMPFSTAIPAWVASSTRGSAPIPTTTRAAGTPPTSPARQRGARRHAAPIRRVNGGDEVAALETGGGGARDERDAVLLVRGAVHTSERASEHVLERILPGHGQRHVPSALTHARRAR